MGEINTDLPIEKVIINDIEVPVAIPSGYANVGDTTATADTVMEGKEFYNAQGEKTVGTYKDMLQARVDSNNSCEYLFYYYKGTTIDFINNLDTSNVTSMQNMFRDCSILKSIDLSGLDTRNVTDMTSMFNGCSKLELLDLSSFDTSKVTTMSYMFPCRGLTGIIFGENFDTSNVINMSGMFSTCEKLESLDLSSFDTSKVTTMSYMFANCFKLQSLDLTSFNTSNVTNMSNIFQSCKLLTSIDLSHFDMTKTSSTNNMFSNCYALTNVILPSTIKKIDSYCFSNCSALTEFTILAETPPTLANTTNCISTATTKIKIPAGTLSAYQSATNWNVYSDLFEELPA